MSMNVPHDEHPLALETADEYIHGDYSTQPTDADRVSVYACPACLKRFTSASNLDRHLVNNSTCKRWIDMGKADIDSRTDWDLEHLRGSEKLTGTLIKSLVDGTDKATPSCVCCDHVFANNSALNRHYKTSLVCDRVRALNVLNTLACIVDSEDLLLEKPV
jgi:hypothetical protein